MGRLRPTKPSWSDVALPGNAISCFSVSNVLPRSSQTGRRRRRDKLYEELVAVQLQPLVSFDSMVGQAVVARRLGDLARRGPCSRRQAAIPSIGPSRGQTGVLAGLAWWALSAGKADEALACATEATQVASASGDR